MNHRHRAREIALQILYQYDLASSQSGATPLQPTQIIGNLQQHYEHFQVPEGLREFVGQLVAGTLNEISTLDAIIDEHMSNWKISRLSSVDRCLLRMATYEMLRLNGVPDTIVINEAVDLAKQFGTSETPAFINGVLDAIKAKAEACHS